MHERPLREVHCEVLRPTQRSPCLGCPRELEPKEDCADGCDRLRTYQAAAADISDRTHTHELVGERTAPVKQAVQTKTVPAAKPPGKKEQTPRAKEIQEAVRKVIDGYPAGHEFTFPDLVQDVSRLLGRTVTANTLGNWFYGSARPPGISCRKVGRKNKRIYRKLPTAAQKKPNKEKEPPPAAPPPPAQAREPTPAPASPPPATMAAAITIHLAIDRNRLMEFLNSLGVNIVPDGVELGAIYLRSA